MDRINTLNKALDLFGVGKHGWKNRNIGLGVEPTEFTADWCNGVQEELLSVIEAAGIVPAGATRNQVLLALRAAGVFATPPQFDNTSKAATTAFVTALGVQFNGESVLATSQTLGSSSAGKVIIGNSASPITLTLPAANTFPVGAGFSFLNVNSGVVTVLRAGADVIVGGAANQNSFALGAGDTLQLESLGAGGWRAIGGSAQLGLSAQFGASASVNGYQKLPSGLLVQWGQSTFNFAGVGTLSNLITFPIAFTGAPYSITTCAQTNAPSAYASSAASQTATNFNLFAYAAGAAAGQVFFWMAVGK